jgi:NADPH:quinone reductase-like Zn-dependent oxidoreductase
VLGLLASGALSAQVAARFPLIEAAAALRFGEAGGSSGKVVVIPGESGV